jgi:hypothetical protein
MSDEYTFRQKITGGSAKRVEYMRKKLEVESVTEIIRRALKTFDWLVRLSEYRRGLKIVITDKDDNELYTTDLDSFIRS